ncbi:lipoprotein-releasing system ATP-binding protein LolD [Undibacterium sp. KW1]|uniref:ABC transporter ATP-binding protein n=1 Tax=Undibacterium sp. KW1 TaxID=2058624 RepID=UPI001331CBFE|nr:ABC transporter ATP-binding protein [Undibacterium sp. KW1]BBB59323.1 lipoprotein-releasing system ATP-binding protein LolD [Undibacterium sp. KW1]
MAESLLRLENLNKSYGLGTPAETQVLHDIQIDISKGEFVALIGPSGSGKSTLLNIIGLLDRPSSGLLYLTGKETSTMNDAELTHLRGAAIGFVFQAHYLLSAFTATENVMIPLMMQKGHADADMRQRAEALLAQVGLEQWKNNMVGNMSGGQQQRVAIARALALNPPLILADEPTGNLDTKSTDAIFELMRKLNVENGTTFLMVTHNMDLAQRCDRIIELVDGRVV